MTRLEALANGAVILAALVVIGVTIHDHLQPGRVPRRDALIAELVGKPIPLPGDSSSRQTVALFVSSTCRFCANSMDFYRKLSALRGRTSCEFRLLALGPSDAETKNDIREYLARNELVVDDSNVMNFAILGVRVTPTVVIQDARNCVRHAWFGLLDQEGQDEVVSKINASCRA
jgi:hypothetical protein